MGETVRIGLLGCGNVGSAVARLLSEHADDIERRAAASIHIVRVAVTDPAKERDAPVPAELFTTDAEAVATAADVDVVIEVMGGVEPARTLILKALAAGKPVVTANKELLATHAGELFEAARASGVELLYEASVGGGIPLIRPLRESLAGERILRFMGIVNGTTNYILTRMTEEGWTLPDAVAEAQRLGYAERDPTSDLDGFDAAAKAAILASIAFDSPVSADDVHREGIRGVRSEDIVFAGRLGYVIKLLAVGELVGGAVSVRVYPAMIPAAHPLASVRESFNAVYIEGEKVGPLMLYGRGAGGDPTATAVVGDVVELARYRGSHTPVHSIGHAATPMDGLPQRRIAPIEDLDSQYYVLMRVADRPGVLATIAWVFAEHEVSIKSVWQEGRTDDAEIVLITHRARERALQACVEALRRTESVDEVCSVLRVEAGEP